MMCSIDNLTTNKKWQQKKKIDIFKERRESKKERFLCT